MGTPEARLDLHERLPLLARLALTVWLMYAQARSRRT